MHSPHFYYKKKSYIIPCVLGAELHQQEVHVTEAIIDHASNDGEVEGDVAIDQDQVAVLVTVV